MHNGWQLHGDQFARTDFTLFRWLMSPHWLSKMRKLRMSLPWWVVGVPVSLVGFHTKVQVQPFIAHDTSLSSYLSKAHEKQLLRGETESGKFGLCPVGLGFLTQIGSVAKLQAPVVCYIFPQSELSVELKTNARRYSQALLLPFHFVQ